MKYKQKHGEKSICDHTSPNPLGLFSRYPQSWHPQTNYSPVNPAKQALPELDNSPQAVKAREKAARRAVLVPLAAILGVIAVLGFGVLWAVLQK